MNNRIGRRSKQSASLPIKKNIINNTHQNGGDESTLHHVKLRLDLVSDALFSFTVITFPFL